MPTAAIRRLASESEASRWRIPISSVVSWGTGGKAFIHYRVAIGLNAGKKALTLRTVPVRPEPFASTLLATQPGFSLHAVTRCEAK